MQQIDLEDEGPILVKYHNQLIHIAPVKPHTVVDRRLSSNIRILPPGGGIRSKPTMRPRTPFLLRMTEGNGSPTNYDTRIPTTCIELEPHIGG